jgi:hypothetical protein
MATSPYIVQAPALGQKVINNASGTADQSVFVAGVSGAQLASMTIYSGPTTAPGGTYTVYVKIFDGSATTTIIYTFQLVNTVDTLQAIVPLGIDLAASAEIRVSVSTAIASGATLHCTITGRTY